MDRPADSAAERRIENITRQPDQPLAMLVDLALGSGPEPEGWWPRGRPSPRLSFAQLRTPSINGTFGVASLIMGAEQPTPVPPGVVEALVAFRISMTVGAFACCSKSWVWK